MSSKFRVGDYAFYFDGKTSLPCLIIDIKKRVKIVIGDGIEELKMWVSAYSLTLQYDRNNLLRTRDSYDGS